MISNECLGVKTSEKLFLICARLSTHGRLSKILLRKETPRLHSHLQHLSVMWAGP